MLRSFLSRPHPLLSNLRPHDRRFVAQLGRRTDNWIKSRGYSYTSSEDENVGRPDAKQHSRRKHLYVVLDDWKKGFSIHKLDLDDASDRGEQTLLQAPVHRQATGDRYWNFAAVGSKIVAAGRVRKSEEDGYATLIYDTETAGLSIVPCLPQALHEQRWYLAAAVGNGLLYTVDTNKSPRLRHGSMHLFGPETQREKYRPSGSSSDHWSWSSIPTPLPFCVHNMESSAVHPAEGGGRTFFISVGEWNKIRKVRGRLDTQDDQEDPRARPVVIHDGYVHTSQAFSYDTETSEWRPHGDWELPFCGHAHYDDELDAWIGLHKIYKDINDPPMTDGYLCSCDLTSPDGSAVQPAWKLSSRKLFDPDMWSHVGASLVHMGGSNYCLVEVMALESFSNMHCVDIGNKCVIRVATFCLKYGKKGELTVTEHRRDRSYLFSRFYKSSEVRAFSM